jgi:hypothetical protein
MTLRFAVLSDDRRAAPQDVFGRPARLPAYFVCPTVNPATKRSTKKL